MKAISRRLRELETRLGSGPGIEQKMWVVTIVGRKLALDQDSCIEILRECNFLPTARFGVVDLSVIPEGLSADDTKRFLRVRAAETCHRSGTR
jgi:hypothetical protein